ncbi:uncharacterized protein LOC125239452 [Leguminivora glycinivorella]|uniref:uncharacterized protein LOC125239452 n=1 Tax=Leguminivora glycinivorella TaxID=1035111 RepID=UPI00200CC63D|nr:uncharacterized protein LOC125239452 [Leguminivora glycinivorella]
MVNMRINRCRLVVVLLILFLDFLVQLAWAQGTWNDFFDQKTNSLDDVRHIQRLGELMQSFLTRADVRWKELIPIHTRLIETSRDQPRAFEKGYIMGDIVECYRKAVVFTHKQLVSSRYVESERIRYMTFVQHAYIKMYHLTHMMHEVDPKFKADNTGQISLDYLNRMFQSRSPSHYNTSGFEYTNELNAIREARVKERRKKVIQEKKIRQWEVDTLNKVHPGTIKTTTNWWPIAYGWDIDYYW